MSGSKNCIVCGIPLNPNAGWSSCLTHRNTPTMAAPDPLPAPFGSRGDCLTCGQMPDNHSMMLHEFRPAPSQPAERNDKAEMDKLCAFLLMNYAGSWERTESAADVAIRFISELATHPGSASTGPTDELKEYRDLFFGAEASFRNGYMCGISDAHITSIGNKPYGEERRWEQFSASLKSWDPAAGREGERCRAVAAISDQFFHPSESNHEAAVKALRTLSLMAKGREGEEEGAGGMDALREDFQTLNTLHPFDDPARPAILRIFQFCDRTVRGRSASSSPQRAFGQIREAVEKLVDDFDRACVEFWRTPRVFEEGKEKAKIAKAKNRSALLAALLGEAPPTSGEAELENIKSRYSPVEKLLRPQPTPGATVQPQADTCEWKESDPDFESLWETTCGRSWTFPEGDPTENEVNFCIGCGKPTKIIRYVPEPEPEDDGAQPPHKGGQA